MSEQTTKPKVLISEVLQMLKDGKYRPEIAEHYGLSLADTRRLFKHPQLANKKTIVKREPPFEIIDDVTVADEAPETVDDVNKDETAQPSVWNDHVGQEA